MKIGLIGLGSMGKRRLRLLQEIDPALEIIGIDAREDRRKETEELFGIETADDAERAILSHGIEAVVISTSPASHGKIAGMALRSGCHVFTELNLVKDGYEENMALAKEKGLVLFLSSTMLYRKEIGQIGAELAKATHPVNYIYHVGQYLPTWHKHEDYRDFFVADKRTNGCRELFSVELPWLIEVFGPITEAYVMKGTMTDLEVDYPDHYEVSLKHESGTVGTLHINVASIKAVRNLEVYGQDCYLRWGGAPDSLTVYDAETNTESSVDLYENAQRINKQNSTIVEDAYREELVEFLGAIQGDRVPRYSYEQDLAVLELIDKIEE